MRKIILMVWTVCCSIGMASSQTIQVGQYAVANSNLQDGKIKVTNNVNSTFLFSLSSTRPSFFDKPVQQEIKLVFVGAGVEYDVSSVVSFTTSDFVGSSFQSNFKDGIVGTILKENRIGNVYARYRYNAQSYPGESDGWTGWFTHSKVYSTIDVTPVPETIISGPSSICTEEIYTITNPGTITLENATGVATLTDLGGGQFKITRTSSANRVVTLKSINNGVIKQKSIQLGYALYSIDGYAAIGYDGGTYTFTLNTMSPGPGGTGFSWHVSGLPPGATLSGQNTRTLRIHMPFYSTGPTGGYIIMNTTITSSSCGGAIGGSKTITYGTIPSGGGGGGGTLPTPIIDLP